jgi:hypothetical protein
MRGIAWLPEMLNVNPWSEDTYDELYAIFKNDFIDRKVKYRGYNVWFFPEIENGKEVIFWHLTDKGKKFDRFPDTNRSPRISWIRPMIERCPDSDILDWDVEEDGVIKSYVWLQNLDYVVIMKRMPDGSRRLLTAHYLDYANMSHKLKKKYERRIGIGT